MSQNPELQCKESVSEPELTSSVTMEEGAGLAVPAPEESADTISESDEKVSHQAEAKEETLTLSADRLSELLHQAYMRGRNENIEARIESDCKTGARRSAAGELLFKGLECAAKVLLKPGRRSIWPTKR